LRLSLSLSLSLSVSASVTDSVCLYVHNNKLACVHVTEAWGNMLLFCETVHLGRRRIVLRFSQGEGEGEGWAAAHGEEGGG
jgi:hypothetical protein